MFRARLLSLLLITAVTAASASEVEEPLLVKKTFGGNAAPGVSTYETCTIYPGTVSYQGPKNKKPVILPLEFTKKVSDLPELRKTIVMTKAGKLETSPGPTDGPTTRYVALLKENIGPAKQILLRQLAHERIENSAKEPKEKLVDLIDHNCKPKAETVAFLSDNLFTIRWDEVQKKIPEGFVLKSSKISVTSTRLGADVFVYLTLINKKEARDTKPFGAIIGKVKYDGKNPPEVLSSGYRQDLEP